MSGMIKCKDPRVFAADAPSKTKSKHFTQMLNQAVSNYMNTSLQASKIALQEKMDLLAKRMSLKRVMQCLFKETFAEYDCTDYRFDDHIGRNEAMGILICNKTSVKKYESILMGCDEWKHDHWTYKDNDSRKIEMKSLSNMCITNFEMQQHLENSSTTDLHKNDTLRIHLVANDKIATLEELKASLSDYGFLADNTFFEIQDGYNGWYCHKEAKAGLLDSGVTDDYDLKDFDSVRNSLYENVHKVMRKMVDDHPLELGGGVNTLSEMLKIGFKEVLEGMKSSDPMDVTNKLCRNERKILKYRKDEIKKYFRDGDYHLILDHELSLIEKEIHNSEEPVIIHTARDALYRVVMEIQMCNSEFNAFRRLYFVAFCEFSAVRKSGGRNYNRTKSLRLLSIPEAKHFMLLGKDSDDDSSVDEKDCVDSSDNDSSDDDSVVDDNIRIQSGTIALKTKNVHFDTPPDNLIETNTAVAKENFEGTALDNFSETNTAVAKENFEGTALDNFSETNTGAAKENFEQKKPHVQSTSTVDMKEFSSPELSGKRFLSVPPIVTPNKGKKPKIRAATITRVLFENSTNKTDKLEFVVRVGKPVTFGEGGGDECCVCITMESSNPFVVGGIALKNWVSILAKNMYEAEHGNLSSIEEQVFSMSTCFQPKQRDFENPKGTGVKGNNEQYAETAYGGVLRYSKNDVENHLGKLPTCLASKGNKTWWIKAGIEVFLDIFKNIFERQDFYHDFKIILLSSHHKDWRESTEAQGTTFPQKVAMMVEKLKDSYGQTMDCMSNSTHHPKIKQFAGLKEMVDAVEYPGSFDVKYDVPLDRILSIPQSMEHEHKSQSLRAVGQEIYSHCDGKWNDGVASVFLAKRKEFPSWLNTAGQH